MLFHKINSKKESNETKKNTQQNNSNQSGNVNLRKSEILQKPFKI